LRRGWYRCGVERQRALDNRHGCRARLVEHKQRSNRRAGQRRHRRDARSEQRAESAVRRLNRYDGRTAGLLHRSRAAFVVVRLAAAAQRSARQLDQLAQQQDDGEEAKQSAVHRFNVMLPRRY